MTITEECDALARKLYVKMYIPNKGARWDKWDDEREIDAIRKQIEAIASNAYIQGSNTAHQLLTQ